MSRHRFSSYLTQSRDGLLPLCLLAGGAFLLTTASAWAQSQKDYQFTNIADTTGQFSDFSANSFSVNSSGTVAFSAALKSGARGIFTSSGATPAKIVQTGEPLENRTVVEIGDTAAISNSGTVAFRAFFGEFQEAIYTSFGATATKAAPLYYYDLKSPGINSAGKVAWSGFFGFEASTGFNSSRHYVLRSPAEGESGQQGSAGAIIAHSGGQDNITGYFSGFGLANINDTGLVVFRATIRSGGEGIYANSDALPDRFGPGNANARLVADTVSPGSPFSGFGDIARNRPDVNNANVVVFGATLKAGGQGIFRAFAGGVPSTLVDNTGAFSQVSLTPAINSSGVVAFTGTVRRTGRTGVFVGPDPIEDAVIQTGAALFGSTVTAVGGGARTISDSGHVAFSYQLADGRRGIAVAKPAGEKKPTGDLVIKEAKEPTSAFSTPGIYVPVPAGNQLRIVSFEPKPGSEVVFDVELRNNSTKDERYVLTGFEAGDAGWKIEALAGTFDNWPGIRGSGARTPVMQPGARIALKMRMTSSSGAALPRGSGREFVLTAISDEDPGFIHDAVGARAEAVAINITMHRPTFGGLSEASIAGGIDDPLEFKTDRNTLAVQPQVASGLVADGVTPLLLKLKADALQELEYDATLELEGGGTLRGFPVGERLRLLKNGRWTTDRRMTFGAGQNEQYLQIDPIIADDLQLAAGQTELKLRVRLRHAASGELAESRTILIRRPHITLIHGYNTGGEWGGAFVQTLKRTRSGEFIKVVRYGQEPQGTPATSRLNTVLPFGDLAFMLDNELNAVRREVALGWAFTRHDAVCHSQGGVLARMLLTQNSNRWVSEPFRSDSNFRRGRFHRVVTIGSPHNGTRLVRYMIELKARFGLLAFVPPELVSFLLINDGTSQPKFDPIGADIIGINDPNPNAPWFPDPAGKIHMVQTSAPKPGGVSLSELGLGLAITGGAVVPVGSDGVVDVESMGATPRGGFSRSNVFYINPAEHAISHAYVDIAPEALVIADRLTSLDLFGGEAGQVTSVAAADHIIGALDQTNGAIFGPFIVPPRIPQADVEAIREAAGRLTPGGILRRGGTSAAARTSALSAPEAFSNGGVFDFQVDPGALSRPVIWSGTKYGAAGARSRGGFTLQPVADQPAAVSVSVDNAEPGDVVLHGTAYLRDGTARIAPAFRAAAIEPSPADYRIASIEVLPAGGEYPLESAVMPELWVNYQCISNGCAGDLRVRRWIDPGEFRAASSAPGVVNVGDPLNWVFTAAGSATVSIDWRGHVATAAFRIYDPAAVAGGALLNISTRLRVGMGDNALIGGFIITGSESKKVIIRAIGPSLAAQGVGGVLENPTLELFDGAGDPIAFNDNWKDDQRGAIEESTIPPNNDSESAIVRTLAPGNYTAVMRGKNNGTGVGLVEVYDLASATPSKLANISSRGFVETGENALIGGFIIGGSGSAKVVVRAIGPSLTAQGVNGALGDPTLELIDANGTTIRANDNWRSDQQAELERIGIQPTNDAESALIATLGGGSYTATVRGKNDTIGIALVELYNVP